MFWGLLQNKDLTFLLLIEETGDPVGEVGAHFDKRFGAMKLTACSALYTPIWAF
jgi:hypothetical protein